MQNSNKNAKKNKNKSKELLWGCCSYNENTIIKSANKCNQTKTSHKELKIPWHKIIRTAARKFYAQYHSILLKWMMNKSEKRNHFALHYFHYHIFFYYVIPKYLSNVLSLSFFVNVHDFTSLISLFYYFMAPNIVIAFFIRVEYLMAFLWFSHIHHRITFETLHKIESIL